MMEENVDWLYVGGEVFKSYGATTSSHSLTDIVKRGKDKGIKVGIMTPRITTSREFQELELQLNILNANLEREMLPDCFLVQNIGTIKWLRDRTDIPMHADFSLNVGNSQAVSMLAKYGVQVVTAGLESDFAQIAELAEHSMLPLECVVHGALPGMLLQYCAIGSHVTGTTRNDPCPGPCTGANYALQSRVGQEHWLETDQYCRNHLFMAKDLCSVEFLHLFDRSNIQRIRIEGALYETGYLRSVVRVYRQAIENIEHSNPLTGLQGRIEADAPRPLTVGAYGNKVESVSNPCEKLPTDLMISYG